MRIRYTLLRDSGHGWVRYFLSGYLRVLSMEEVPNHDLVEVNLKKDFVNGVAGWHNIGDKVEIPALTLLN